MNSDRPFLASAPAKLILFGEWSVLEPDGWGIATALKPRFHVEFNADQSGSCKFISKSDPEVSEDFFLNANKILKNLGFSASGTFTFNRGWQLNEGLGSSSALSLCLSLVQLKHQVPPNDELWQQGLSVLRALQGKASGLDLGVQIYGKSVCLHKNKIQPIALEFPEELCLIHTGKKISTTETIKNKSPDPEILKRLGSSAALFLENRNWQKTIDEHYEALCDLGVVPDFVKEAREFWTRKFWITNLKTTGAGGGDGLLCWVNPSQRKSLEEDIRSRNWWISPYDWNSAGFEIGS